MLPLFICSPQISQSECFTNRPHLSWRLSSVQFSCSVMSDSLWPHGLQYAKLPCPSPTPRAYSNSQSLTNSCPLSQWCHPTISSSVVLLPSIFPSNRVFSNESVLCIRWPKYWSFSFNISPSNEYSGLISLRIDWLDLLSFQGTLKGFPCGSAGKESAYNVGDLGSIPELGRPPGEGNESPLQYFCLENSMDRGAWWAIVYGVTNSWTRLSY